MWKTVWHVLLLTWTTKCQTYSSLGNRKQLNHLLWIYRREIPENHACQRTVAGQLLVIIHNIIPTKTYNQEDSGYARSFQEGK